MLFLILLTLAWSTGGQAQTLDKAKLDQFFDRLAEKNKAMGSVTIAKEGRILYTRAIGYGQINGTERKPLTAETRFRIGSVSKMFTAAMILQLVDERKLKLTDTLDKFFPQIPNARIITIEQILAHRSGIHDSLLDRNLRPASKTNAITKDELLALIAQGAPDFEPDTKHSYSNSGYALLGLILEKVTGQLYAEALKQRITSKIGLKDTYTSTGKIDVNNGEALTYFHFGGPWKQVPETHPSLLFGAGSIVSTPKDLARFIHALFDLKLISQDSLHQMKTMRDGYGLGMGPFTFAGKTFYGHTGGADNYGAWVAYEPEEKLAVAYTTNAKVYPVAKIVRGVVEISCNQPFQIPALESISVRPEVLEHYVGVYSTADAPVKFRITREDATLYAQPPGESSTVPLEATAQNQFKIDNGTPAGIVFEFDAAKNQMTIKRSGRERVFTKDK